MARKASNSPVPVTVLTGFLGSGKTTLLNNLLQDDHGKRFAVIENEFGEIPIDNDLVITVKEQLFELKDGCMCCTVREDLIKIVEELVQGNAPFDHIILETTGLADPAPVAQTFFVEEGIKDRATLDSVVTVVDAKNVLRQIEDSRACLDQIAFADVIFLNKCDLATSAELDSVESRLRAINAIATIHRIQNGQAPVKEVLDRGGFNLERALESKPAFLQAEYPFAHASTFDLQAGLHELQIQEKYEEPMGMILLRKNRAMRELERVASAGLVDGAASEVPPGGNLAAGTAARLQITEEGPKGFKVQVPAPGPYVLFLQGMPDHFGIEMRLGGQGVEPLEAVDYMAGHVHDGEVESVSLEDEGIVNVPEMVAWLKKMLHERAKDMYRVKGIFNDGTANRQVVHAVHELVDVKSDREWREGEERLNQVVFIGRGLDEEELGEGIRPFVTY